MSDTVQALIGIVTLAVVFPGIGYLIGRSSRKGNQILDDTIARRRLAKVIFRAKASPVQQSQR